VTDFSINVTGITELSRKLSAVPTVVRGDVEYAVAGYMLNVLGNKEIPPYRHVARKIAYPETGDGFFSNRQRRWFFWALRAGILQTPYRRRGKRGIAGEWYIDKQGDRLVLTNRDPGAMFLYSDTRQARQLAMVGWKRISVIVQEYSKKLDAVMVRAVKSALKKIFPEINDNSA
jgi:hypothetical protein